MQCLFSHTEKVKVIDYIDNKGEKHYRYELIQVSCGKCIACRANKAYDWETRILAELDSCYSASFVTFTYDEDNLPLLDDGSPCFSKRDLQLFFKKLRKNVEDLYDISSPPSIRYFLVSEYGDYFARPHYHAIIFNLPYVNDYLKQTELLNTTWNKGFVTASHVALPRIRYLLKYFTKEKAIYNDIPQKVPFILSSRNPALGLCYITDNINRKRVLSRNLEYEINIKGKSRKMPDYFKRKIFSRYSRNYINYANKLEHESKYITVQTYLNALENSFQGSSAILQKRIRETRGELQEQYRREYEQLKQQYELKINEFYSMSKIDPNFLNPINKQQLQLRYAQFKSTSLRPKDKI